MKLTHDDVRALLESHRSELCAQHSAAAPAECSLCGLHAFAISLCEQWLAAHTVRWIDDALVLLGGKEVASVGAYSWRFGWVAMWGLEDNDPEHTCSTKAEARAWCEEQAKAEGYEVADRAEPVAMGEVLP